MSSELIHTQKITRELWERVKKGGKRLDETEMLEGWFVSVLWHQNELDLLDLSKGPLWFAGPGWLMLNAKMADLMTVGGWLSHGLYPSGAHLLSPEVEATYLRLLWIHAANIRMRGYEAEVVRWEAKERQKSVSKRVAKRKANKIQKMSDEEFYSPRMQAIKCKLLRGLHN